jgi:hypothetical protein
VPCHLYRYDSPIDPRAARWAFARDHLSKWMDVYGTIGLNPPVYLLNRMSQPIGLKAERGDHAVPEALTRDARVVVVVFQTARGDGVKTKMCASPPPPQIFARGPSGTTDMTSAILRALADHEREAPGQGLFLLIPTDGEANDMTTFRNLLDAIQNGRYGDVQVCLVGLSLVEKDIAWFEDEECDDTRIRTVEAFEVEQPKMLI